MKKKLTIILPLILMITLIIVGSNSENVYADIKSDIDGQIPGGGGGGSEGEASVYDTKISTIIKINLVDVSGSYPKEKSSFYYVYCNECTQGNDSQQTGIKNIGSNDYTADNYFARLINKGGSANVAGKWKVCGSIGTSGNYKFSTTECESIEYKWYKTSNWFLVTNAAGNTQTGLNIKAEGIKTRFGNVSNYVDVINKLKVRDIIGRDITTNDITGDGLNTEQKLTLKKYRVIVEPVYAFEDRTGKYTFSTLKGIAKHMVDSGKSGNNLSVSMAVFPYQVFASKQHGTIKPNDYPLGSLVFNSAGYNYYNTIANVNSGYGYGIFHIIGGCDPSYECCYDDGGNFREDYFGDTNNYRCNSDVGSADCPIDELEQCVSEPEEITPQECLSDTGTGSLPGTLNCTGANYYQVKNVSINDFEPGGIDTEKWRNFIKTKKGNSSNTGGCDSSVTVEISGEASIEQEGNIGFSLDNTATYHAGGGFGFSISYSTNAKYSICNPGLKFVATRQYASYSCENEPEDEPEDEYDFTILDDGEDYDYDGYYDLITKTEYDSPTINGTTCYYDKTVKEIYLKVIKIHIDDVYLTSRESRIKERIRENGEYCLNNWLYEDDYDDEDFTNEYDEYDCIRVDLNKMENEEIELEEPVIPDDPPLPEDWYLDELGHCFAYEQVYDNIYNCYEYKDEQIGDDTIEEDAIETCYPEDAETYCSGNCLSTGDATEVNVSDEIKQVYEYMKDEYLNEVELNDNSQVKSYNSNVVSNTYESMQGIWDESYNGYDNLSDATEQSGVELWYPGQTINFTANYNLSQACIGLYPSLDMKIKSPVAYTSDTCSGIESATQKYLDGNNLYYIPLKQPTGSFPVKANTINTQGLSLVNNMSWNLDYSCSVNVEQRLYKTNGKYKFIYRPINRYDPFPNREEGSNWTNLRDNNSTVFNQKVTEGRNNSNLEYEIRLTPQSIISLKGYTKSYNDMSTISENGKSTILNNFSFNRRTNNYNGIGVCTNDCW